VALAMGACVTKAKHEQTVKALDAQLADAQRQVAMASDTIATRDGEVKRLEQALADEQAKVAALDAEKAAVQQELAAATARLAQLDEELATTQRNLAEVLKKRAGLKADLDRMAAAMAQMTARQVVAELRVAEYKGMLAKFKALIDAGTLDVQIVEGRMVLILPVDILFPSGSTKLAPAGIEALAKVGAVLATIAGKEFQVEGHTDNVPIRNDRFASNWELAAGRALVVLHALLDAGVPPTQLSAASHSEYDPRESNTDAPGRAKNRRIEIVVVPDLTGLPGYDELTRAAGG